MSRLSDYLEILIPTYNRKPHITRTLTQLTAPESPVRTCSITVLDNASEDGSSEAIAQFAAKFPNVKHVRHAKNIGGNANIARAFEMARAEYVWVLCDDDKYDFSNWKECEHALATHPAAVVVANYIHPQNGPAYLFRQLSFVPAAIYRTDLITSTTLMNMYCNIVNMFPQLALAAAAFNSKDPMPILSQPLVTMQLNSNNDSYTRGSQTTSKIHPTLREMNWMKGYLPSISMLENSDIRTQCCFCAQSEDECFYNYCGRFMEKGSSLLYTYIYGIHFHNKWAKLAFTLLAPLALTCSFFCDEKGINIRLFGKIKVRIWKFLKSKSS